MNRVFAIVGNKVLSNFQREVLLPCEECSEQHFDEWFAKTYLANVVRKEYYSHQKLYVVVAIPQPRLCKENLVSFPMQGSILTEMKQIS